MHHTSTAYRTHTCGRLRGHDVGTTVTLCGWLHCRRHHGQVLFIELRDHYGRVQCVTEQNAVFFETLASCSIESVLRVHGEVIQRTPSTINKTSPTGEIELRLLEVEVLSRADVLPMSVQGEENFPEETRLKYRFLDLRREAMHRAIEMRSHLIAFLRSRMEAEGFLEIQTPILTATSPEGARDFVVPSRLHPGTFYALPQAPQQFKQLLMVSGFDRYFQIAPCFRDESSRADRSPGEFYQLDMEMSFVNQEDVWRVMEGVLYDTFKQFAPHGYTITPPAFPRIPYAQAMIAYGCDKPDLRNPLQFIDVTGDLVISPFQSLVEGGAVIRALVVPGLASQSNAFFKTLQQWAKTEHGKNFGYLTRTEGGWVGPLHKFCTPEQVTFLESLVPQDGGVFILCDREASLVSWCASFRNHVGEKLGLIDKKGFAFCWVTDFPMYERDETTGNIVFSHNPFSMPQGGMEALCTQDPLTIKAYQYDIVCNGIELSSGAIRNHLPKVMYKAFEIAGYDRDHVHSAFGALVNAFCYGAPPHGGCAPGIDRMVMLLAETPNIREVIAFPLNQRAQDILMNAPSPISPAHLEELGLRHVPPHSSGKKASPMG